MSKISKFIAGFFNTGQRGITIACVNHATANPGVDFNALVAALQKYVTRYVYPVWNTPAKVIVASAVGKGQWGMVFTDTADQADALGYHDLTVDGFPLSKIFVKTTLDDGEIVSVTASHEIVEMLVDPAINLCAQALNGTIYAYETADAVEETWFPIDGVQMSNFVYPSWFESFHAPGSTRFDYLKRVNSAFEILPGGYMSVFEDGQWSQIFGSKQAEKDFKKQNRTGRRNHRRTYLNKKTSYRR